MWLKLLDILFPGNFLYRERSLVMYLILLGNRVPYLECVPVFKLLILLGNQIPGLPYILKYIGVYSHKGTHLYFACN
jgi:hypothetical protein